MWTSILYDEEGRLLTSANHVVSGPFAGKLVHTEFIYNDQGRMASTKNTLPGEWEEETLYFYDEQGNEIRWETYSDGKLALIDIFEGHDDHHHAAKRSTYNAEGQEPQLLYYQLREYDYKAYTETTYTYDASGTLEGWHTITYASDWRTPLHWISYDADGSIKYERHAEQDQ